VDRKVKEHVNAVLAEMSGRCAADNVLPLCLICCAAAGDKHQFTLLWVDGCGKQEMLAGLLRAAADNLEKSQAGCPADAAPKE
jgi:hypothetical protein